MSGEGGPNMHHSAAQTCDEHLAGQRDLSSDQPRIKHHSVIPAPLHHQNSVGTCGVPSVAQ
eukprot:CAMPEP_0174320886 /NCGR_PEP_ID=MMETSP0810-20121108/9875_1 /TAXON_ID=73025 ORGANISM="Eutreptiella gymnastica-like, Strain CCMP1594" /NCGR_SAMPLE_ID=MMETSP0810 /ASSEMBLY_ACC=CAM_ASM_000659 /LENGTH=60 /DNA_ID=CAMNT_0015432001 /DNA_START=408 /DNA_END=590 /DNA_ORIENTATION=-